MAGVKGKSGRKPKSLERAHTDLSIAESGEDAARLIKEVAKGGLLCAKCGAKFKVDRLSWENAWKIVEQLLGRAPQRIQEEITGAIAHAQMTGDEFAKLYRDIKQRSEGEGVDSLPTES